MYLAPDLGNRSRTSGHFQIVEILKIEPKLSVRAPSPSARLKNGTHPFPCQGNILWSLSYMPRD
ncbi:MAG: hypothetical protein AUI12_00735 [Acidobacteria bacterium 13_2_20CM_2_57_6]|nr:MAG: hypothetical protein AUI12_00735 [Acidobacteria bacterium 13_2_20CM_2_57_6]PYT36060.1 MAG: hypothetical protein DMG58_00490 [Acidobacteriota bacterium]PYT39520.1 MAG: hypothetical protein DMG47_21330 [Acidobacteriota bacterium]PYT42898.1 MAG: hypothetical protein DMG45_08405 [Acidobacteriota bacterium]PYT60167.1 MAG: hypothetical protein DMG46_08070 [Acidobacteriota bacterium]